MTKLTRKAPQAGDLMIEVVCECPVPKMWEAYTEDRIVGEWWWKTTLSETKYAWNTDNFSWTCPKCHSSWRYNPTGLTLREHIDPNEWPPGSFYSPWSVSDNKRSSWKKVDANP